MTKVVVVTRTKDRPVYLRRAIESVHSQTFTEFIHVIVNDGGDHKSVQQIVDSFPESTKEKIQLFHREKPSGAPDTIFNESIDRVDSDYVAIHDDDDTWHPDFLKMTVKVLDDGAHGVVVRTDNQYEKLVGNEIVPGKTTRHMPHMRAVSLYYQCLDNQLTAGGFVYRRNTYKQIGKYDSTLPVAGDWEFGIRFLMACDVEYVNPGYALAYYHRRPDADNSFAAHDHRKYLTIILNKYLRDDISHGGLGIGYIMNSRWSDRDKRNNIIKRMIPRSMIDTIKKSRK